MKTKIMIWSVVGHTPLTGRGFGYCDELVNETIDCANPDEAAAIVRDRMAKTEHAYMGYFNMPDYPNQNTRKRFMS